MYSKNKMGAAAIAVLLAFSPKAMAETETEKPKYAFTGTCEIKDGAQTSFVFNESKMYRGSISNIEKKSFDVTFVWAMAKNGKEHGYFEVEGDKDSASLMSVIDHYAIANENNIALSSSTSQNSIRLIRTYKKEWRGIYSTTEYQTDNIDNLIVFSFGLICNLEMINMGQPND